MVLDDLADGAPEEWHFYVVLAADAGNQNLQNDQPQVKWSCRTGNRHPQGRLALAAGV
jgi:hypothetical protein